MLDGKAIVFFEKYHSNGKCEVIMVFEEYSLNREGSWKICMQTARNWLCKKSITIHVCLEVWE